MAEARRVVGIFRDRGQARLAVMEALRMGLDVHTPDSLAEDADGVHAILQPPGNLRTRDACCSNTAHTAPRCSGQVLAEWRAAVSWRGSEGKPRSAHAS
jgi:hypothetical protein